jgi:hypothetical protein
VVPDARFGRHEDRTLTHGCERTHEAAIVAAVCRRIIALAASSVPVLWQSSRSPCAILVRVEAHEGQAAQRLDSEQFKFAPRTSRPLCGRLSVRLSRLRWAVGGRAVVPCRQPMAGEASRSTSGKKNEFVVNIGRHGVGRRAASELARGDQSQPQNAHPLDWFFVIRRSEGRCLFLGGHRATDRLLRHLHDCR